MWCDRVLQNCKKTKILWWVNKPNRWEWYSYSHVLNVEITKAGDNSPTSFCLDYNQPQRKRNNKRTKSAQTLASTDGDTGNAFKDLLASSPDLQSEHRNWSNFFASSMVMPIHEGWNLKKSTNVIRKQEHHQYLQRYFHKFHNF